MKERTKRKLIKIIIGGVFAIVTTVAGIFGYGYYKANNELQYIKSGEYFQDITQENYFMERTMDSLIEYFEQLTLTERLSEFDINKFMSWLAINDTELFVEFYEWINR